MVPHGVHDNNNSSPMCTWPLHKQRCSIVVVNTSFDNHITALLTYCTHCLSWVLETQPVCWLTAKGPFAKLAEAIAVVVENTLNGSASKEAEAINNHQVYNISPAFHPPMADCPPWHGMCRNKRHW